MLLMDEDFRAELLKAADKDAFLAVVDKYENAKFPEETAEKTEEKTVEKAPEKKGFRVLAVTACPTGIAHTYMAPRHLRRPAPRWDML